MDRLDALIVLVRDEQFYFSLEINPKGGPLDDFSHFLCGWNPTIFLVFYLFMTSTPLTRIIQPHRIVMYRHILAPFINYVSQSNIKLITSLLLLLFMLLSLSMMLILFLSSLCLVFNPYSIYIQVCWSILQEFHKLDFLLEGLWLKTCIFNACLHIALDVCLSKLFQKKKLARKVKFVVIF